MRSFKHKSGQKAFILAIDDNEKFLRTASRFLKDEGFRNVKTAANGLEGLRKMSEKTPDLVLLDIEMPEIDGFEVIERMRSAEIDTRVVIFSVNNDAASDLYPKN